ncbi:hypothetical protein COV18_05965 [Candidatus Woesearchaeota archaeon CG10_big_fil_rev_8_21_14_0_10_37_12]|nr:MAG: hypothetical protein COV18_05965 [Candidatus Woesearchaeota archaeon CG10_big_fil_rev_8_21_14_0_10_37_12]
MNYGTGGYSPVSGYGAGFQHSSGSYTLPTATYSSVSSGYNSANNYESSSLKPYAAQEHAHFSFAESFLVENRPTTQFVSELGEVREIVEETYCKITGQEFPHDDIKIVICNSEQLKSIHEQSGSRWSPGILGFSFNKYAKGVSEIYVKEDHLDSLLLTIGHEIGHVLSPTLLNAQDEEAKAHAFSLAWMETIRDNNIGGLQPNISLNPAQNGLHDVAFDYVKYLLRTGSSSFDIFQTLAHGLTSIIART